ncbi:MAG TPA: YjbQ family protein, partial [Blastocatellia bacterium]|nr:YjbQ family protein [Blastocatellia bacterium]
MLISFPQQKTLPATFQVFHRTLQLQTRECLQFIDLTEEIRSFVKQSKFIHGSVNIQTHHTTASIIVNENEPLLIKDLKRTLERMAPRDAAYQHDDFSVRTENLTDDEQPNGHAHCKALLLRTSETL